MIKTSTNALLDACQTAVKLAGHIAATAYSEAIINVIGTKGEIQCAVLIWKPAGYHNNVPYRTDSQLV